MYLPTVLCNPHHISLKTHHILFKIHHIFKNKNQQDKMQENREFFTLTHASYKKHKDGDTRTICIV